MDSICLKLTLYHDGQFFVGLFELTQNRRLTVCRTVFPAEPSNRELWLYVLQNWAKLQFSPPVDADARPLRPRNPKRLQREAAGQLLCAGTGTKARQALQLQREQGKLVRRVKSRAEREAEQAQKRARIIEKKKQRHRGR